MKRLTVSDPEQIIPVLQGEIRRSQQSRYDHRLHGVLLVAQGVSCPEVARLLGDAPRTLQYWVRRFEEEGLGGLVEGKHPGRPPRLNEAQLHEIGLALRQPPSAAGLSANLWDGKTLCSYIAQHWDLALGVRQCQRLVRQLGFRLCKPRPAIARADRERQQTYKKTRADGARSRD